MPTDKTYTGQRSEDFGLMDYNARFYGPLLGKFISPDTLIPEPTDFMSWDRYAYVNNNPINFNDPTGHCSFSVGQNVGGLVISCVKDLVDAGIAYLNGVDDPVILTLEATGVKDLLIDTADSVHQMNDDVDTVFSNEPFLDRIGPSIRVGSFAVETAATVVGLGQIAVSFNKPSNSSLEVIDDLNQLTDDYMDFGDFPELSGMLRDAAKGKGNFGIGSASAEQADALGLAWVGKNPSRTNVGYLSADKLRQYRTPTLKPRLGKIQANLEYRLIPEKRFLGNAHIDIIDFIK